MLHRFIALRDAMPEELAQSCRRFDALLRVTGEMHRAGVRLLAGSDAPNPGLVPGPALHQELELLVRAGLSPPEALRAATLNPALYLGLDASRGTLVRGSVADLVVLDADPLQDIRNTRRVHVVIAAGRVVGGSSLRAH